MALQAKLLRVIQQREFDRVGGTATVRVDVRIVSATNRDLQRAVREKQFQEDLYYRISSFPVHLPALRDRRSDVLLLAEHFLKAQATKQGKTVSAFSRPALRMIYQYPWPGNIRELENAIEHGVLLSGGAMVTENDLPVSLRSFDQGEHHTDELARLFDDTGAIVPLERLREEAIRHALKVTGGNILHAARQLGVGRATFYRLMKRYGIPVDR